LLGEFRNKHCTDKRARQRVKEKAGNSGLGANHCFISKAILGLYKIHTIMASVNSSRYERGDPESSFGKFHCVLNSCVSRTEFFLGISMVISMNKVSGKCGKADRDIHRAIRAWSAVGNPFAFARYDSLASIYINDCGSRANLEKAAQDKGVFIEIWSLARLAPARWTNHSRDA
jgi:hypothetical protein